MKREEPSTESRSLALQGTVVFRTSTAAVSGAQVLLIGASPRVGVRPLLALDAVVLNVLGVGLFENAAQSGW